MIDKSKLVDSRGNPLTQGLFLEIGYTDYSVYTLKNRDHEWNGNIYPSIKRLYLEEEDVTEYDFANKHFLDWDQWQRICANKVCLKHIQEWRAELELKLRARAAKQMIEQADAGSFQASKWLADRGWDVRKAGRPSKEDIEKERKIQATIQSEYAGDIARLSS